MPFRTRDITSVILFLLLAGAVLIRAEGSGRVPSVLGGLLFLIVYAAPPVLSCTLPVPLLPPWLLGMLQGINILMRGADGPGGFGILILLGAVWMICLFISLARGVIYIVDHAGRGGYRS